MNQQLPWDFDKGSSAQQVMLSGEHRYQYAVVGGGFTGLSAAYHLAKLYGGDRICLIESEHVGAGASGRNSGMIGPGVWGQYHKMVNKFGERLAASMFSHTQTSVAEAIKLIQFEDLSCDLVVGSQYKVATTDYQVMNLQSEIEALKSSQFEVGFLDSENIKKIVRSEKYLMALHYKNSATVNPLALARELKRKIQLMGVDVYELSPIERIQKGKNSRLEARTGSVKADQIIIALNGYMPSMNFLKNRVFPISTHLLMTKPLSSRQLANIGLDKCNAIIDCRNIFNFYRLTSDNRLIFGGGTPVFSHPDKNNPINLSAKKRLINELVGTFDSLSPDDIHLLWSGTMGFTIDNLPVVGRLPDTNITLAGAWCGHGLALSLANGKYLAESFSGNPNESLLPWNRVSSPLMPPGKLLKPSISTYIAILSGADFIGEAKQKFINRRTQKKRII